jgi:membrane protease YdiL (CAAX protease family)
VFLLCSIARFIEYYLIRKDETVIAENVFHKMFGIIVLLVSLRMTNMSLSDIGFKADYFKHIGKGLLLGFICFTLSYSLEMGILFLQGKHPTLDFYASGFSLQGDAIQQRTIRAALLCLVFNVVNVVMEEGVFRGFNLRIMEGVSSFAKANLLTAFLFGIWHWVMPLRSFTDGESSLTNP